MNKQQKTIVLQEVLEIDTLQIRRVMMTKPGFMQLLDHNRVLPSKLRSTLNNRVIKLCFKHFDLKAEVLS